MNDGELFRLHMDGVFHVSSSERSVYTLLIYLTSGYEGGRTVFLDPACILSSPSPFLSPPILLRRS